MQQCRKVSLIVTMCNTNSIAFVASASEYRNWIGSAFAFCRPSCIMREMHWAISQMCERWIVSKCAKKMEIPSELQTKKKKPTNKIPFIGEKKWRRRRKMHLPVSHPFSFYPIQIETTRSGYGNSASFYLPFTCSIIISISLCLLICTRFFFFWFEI